MRRERAYQSEDSRSQVHSWGNEERIRCLSFKDLRNTVLGSERFMMYSTCKFPLKLPEKK